MAYWDIATMARDGDLNQRVEACVAQEDPIVGSVNMMVLCGAPGWDAAWASAVAADVENPGRDPGVITDGMILSAVQLMLTPPPPEAEDAEIVDAEPETLEPA